MDALLAGLSSRALSEWMAYARLEPFGEDRADLRMGILAAATVNLWAKKGGRAARPTDFMPFYEAPRIRDAKGQKLAASLLGAVGPPGRKRRPKKG